MATLLLGLHRRCGVHSPVRIVDAGTIKGICELLARHGCPAATVYFDLTFRAALRQVSSPDVSLAKQWTYVGEASSQKGRDLFEATFPGLPFPDPSGRCVCGKEARTSHYAQNCVTKELTEVGDCCVGFFRCDQRRCPTCGAVHASENVRCDACKAKPLDDLLKLQLFPPERALNVEASALAAGKWARCPECSSFYFGVGSVCGLCGACRSLKTYDYLPRSEAERKERGWLACARCGKFALPPDGKIRRCCNACERESGKTFCPLCGEFNGHGEAAGLCRDCGLGEGWRPCAGCGDPVAPEWDTDQCESCRQARGWKRCPLCARYAMPPFSEEKSCASCSACREYGEASWVNTCLPSRYKGPCWLQGSQNFCLQAAASVKLTFSRRADETGLAEIDRAWAILQRRFNAAASPANPDFGDTSAIIINLPAGTQFKDVAAEVDRLVHYSAVAFRSCPCERYERQSTSGFSTKKAWIEQRLAAAMKEEWGAETNSGDVPK